VKVYFTGSLLKRNQYINYYRRIVRVLEDDGHKVLQKILTVEYEVKFRNSAAQLESWQKTWNEFVRESECVVVEASYPSTVHVGFEIASLMIHNKPIILLYHGDKNPSLINDLFATRIIKSSYTDNDLENVVRWCMDEVLNLLARRFTFNIDNRLDTFLEIVSREQGVSRSEYIRELIEEKMKKSK